MRNGTFLRNATCPFYESVLLSKGGQVLGINCESLEDNLGFDVENLIRFKSKQDLLDYFELFCCDVFEGCPYYKAIQLKYRKLKGESK